jgi:ribosomal protein S18 acetylase RimI-like enzyme
VTRSRFPLRRHATQKPARILRTERIGFDVVRLDLRHNADGTLTSVTLASDTATPLSTFAIAQLLTTYRERASQDGRPAPTFRTPAITTAEVASYVTNGFTSTATLKLLSKDVNASMRFRASEHAEHAENVQPAQPVRLIRGTARHVGQCAELDRLAFTNDDAFNEHDINAAVEATERSRFRVAVDADKQVVGYAVTGRATRRGYLQRLAVSPTSQRQGIGAALVDDSISWCGAHGVTKMVVNTHVHNDSALRLYQRFGFTDTGLQLHMLERRGH